LNGIELMLPRL